MFSLLGALGCSSPGRLLVSVDSDYLIPDEVPMVRATVRDGAGSTVSSVDFALRARGSTPGAMEASFELPLSFVVEPLEGDSARRVSIEVEAHRTTDASLPPRLTRRAFTGFVEGSTLALPMFLARACEGLDCTEGQTCDLVEGRPICVNATRPPETLRVIDTPGIELMVDTGTDARTTVAEDAFVADALVVSDDASADLDAAVFDAALLDAGHDAGFDADLDSCVGALESCNLRDDDCDGVVDDGFLLESDPANCGRCGNVCASGFACTGGVCGDRRPLAISAGSQHSCAIRGNGAVECWGTNSSGQLGRGAITPRTATHLPVPGIDDAIDVCLGNNHTCALRASGVVMCWGSNSYGKIGNGMVGGNVLTPSAVETITNAVAIGCTTGTTCAVLATGTIKCWGEGYFGTWGNGEGAGSFEPQPTPVDVLDITDAVDIHGGLTHLCVRRADRTVACWGNNTSMQLGSSGSDNARPRPVPGLSDVAEIRAGGSSTCALQRSGAIQCWGANLQGQTGDGTLVNHLTPSPVLGVTDAIDVAVGSGHACAVRATGAVVCWGGPANGALGVGDTSMLMAPVAPLTVPGLSGIQKISSLVSTTCVIGADGGVSCWGNNRGRQAGAAPEGEETGRPRATLPLPAASLRMGNVYVMALDEEGGLYAWGSNQYLTLGRPQPPASSPDPLRISIPNPIAAIEADDFHACAIDDGGAVHCWGNNAQGNLGRGTAEAMSFATPVAIAGLRARSMCIGTRHSCAITTDDELTCWGGNASGQLGDGTLEMRTSPVPVALPSRPVRVSCGELHTCAHLSDDTVHCWGANAHGQLGDGTTTDRLLPTVVPGLHNVVGISSGDRYNCVGQTSGRILCWGSNSEGQIGDGNTPVPMSSVVTPSEVVGITDAVAFGTGDRNACAIRADGTLWCWGANEHGQSGAPVLEHFGAPTQVAGLSSIVEFDGGWDSSCARDASGDVRCMGNDQNGQRGYGYAFWELRSPRRVPGFP